MKRFVFYISIFSLYLHAQPKEGIEFKVNTISGIVIDSVTSKPLMDVNIDIYTGNNILKHSTTTDENGFYTELIVGYLWKPKIRFSMHNYQKKQFRLDPEDLDSSLNMTASTFIVPVPENRRIPDLDRSTITKRAETFFIKGNVFYYLTNKNKADRIIIKSSEAIENTPGFISIKVNDKTYDVEKCYVPQKGRYENLSYILRSLLQEPIFTISKNPLFLSDDMIQPSMIFGTIINIFTGEPVMGAEIILDKPFQRRISDENGKYAFQVNQPGSYHLSINPPPDYQNAIITKPEIIMEYGKGGWYKSNFYVRP